MRVAILAVQGAFIEHRKKLESLGAECIELRKKEDLEQPFDGLILPGGESTVQGKLFHALDHLEHIRSSHSVFDTTADLRTIDTWDSSILAIVRENAEEKFIGIYNFSDQDKVAWINEDDGIYTDLISGHEMEAKGVMIPAFGCFWLCRKK